MMLSKGLRGEVFPAKARLVVALALHCLSPLRSGQPPRCKRIVRDLLVRGRTVLPNQTMFLFIDAATKLERLGTTPHRQEPSLDQSFRAGVH